jgi:DNA-binding MarR family transcriptional regulator
MRSWRAYVVGTSLLRRQLHRELAEAHKLSLVDYEVMVQLSERDGSVRMSELAGDVGATKSKLSHQISRLEAAGFVQRRLCPDDARGVLAELTEKGAEMLRRAAPTHVDGVRDHLVDLMTPEERAVVAAVFERVIDHLDTQTD